MTEDEAGERWAAVSLALTGIIFGAFGAIFLVYPEFLELTGVALETASSRAEVRGFYGGMELGLAVFFLLASRRRGWFRPALVAQVGAFAGMALGRLVGVALEGGVDGGLIWALMGAESIGATVGIVALLKLRRS